MEARVSALGNLAHKINDFGLFIQGELHDFGDDL